jgi:Peptidase family M50
MVLDLVFGAAGFIFIIAAVAAIHELGHAFGAVVVGAPITRMVLGGGGPSASFRIGRSQLIVHALPFGGQTHVTTRSKWRQIVVVACGPVANVVVAVLSIWASSAVATGRLSAFLLGLGIFSALVGASNLLPFRRAGGRKSTDGWKLVGLLIGRRETRAARDAHFAVRQAVWLREHKGSQAAVAYLRARSDRDEAIFDYLLALSLVRSTDPDERAEGLRRGSDLLKHTDDTQGSPLLNPERRNSLLLAVATATAERERNAAGAIALLRENEVDGVLPHTVAEFVMVNLLVQDLDLTHVSEGVLRAKALLSSELPYFKEPRSRARLLDVISFGLLRCPPTAASVGEASELAEQACLVDPDDPVCHAFLAFCRIRQGKIDEAEGLLRPVIAGPGRCQTNPDDLAFCQAVLALTLATKGEHVEAGSLLQAARPHGNEALIREVEDTLQGSGSSA